MKLLLIGHCSFDLWHSPDGTVTEQPGGLLRAAAAAATLAGKNDRIIPLCGVHDSDRGALERLFAATPHVDLQGVFAQTTATHRVHYFPHADGTSVTCAHDVAPPIPFERIRPFLDVNGILLNMISGSDITLDTMDLVRMAVRGEEIPMHFDYHGLTTGINADHERYRRALPEWRRWAFMNDSVQLNEEEVAGLTVEALGEEQTVGHLLTLGVKAVVVTRGSRGASVFTSEHKHIQRQDVGGGGSSADDTVGSGDVFGAAFLFRIVQGGTPVEAAVFAHDLVARLGNAPGGTTTP